MEDILEIISKMISEDENISKEESEETKMMLGHLSEALTSDDTKICAMGESVLKICTLEKFTPFELSSMCATIMCEACKVRAEQKGVEDTRLFYSHIVDSMNKAIEEIFEEIEKDGKCEDGDCKCKCE